MRPAFQQVAKQFDLQFVARREVAVAALGCKGAIAIPFGEQPGFTRVEQAAQQLAPRLEDKTALIVIDDVWRQSDLEPFLQGGKGCARLFTTRRLDLALALKAEPVQVDEMTSDESIDLLTIGFELLMKVLLWVVALVPLAVLGIVASSVGQKEGMKVFLSLIWLIVVVVVGLGCQVTWYLLQMAVFARMSPVRFLKGSLDVMASTFSTASTAATIPITLRSLRKLGISRRSSQLTACIGTNFNNDGTALYQATAALFMAQALGYSLSLVDQVVIVLTTLVASVGAGGIPSGSFVTLPLIFAAVRLPAEKIPILLTVDWFLDRCRTTSNVLGDMTVAVLLDRVWRPEPVSPKSGEVAVSTGSLS